MASLLILEDCLSIVGRLSEGLSPTTALSSQKSCPLLLLPVFLRIVGNNISLQVFSFADSRPEAHIPCSLLHASIFRRLTGDRCHDL